jgi:hypothetical protein
MLDCGMGASSTIFERSYRVYDERDRTFPGPGIGLTIVAEYDRRRTLGRQRARALATREARQAREPLPTRDLVVADPWSQRSCRLATPARTVAACRCGSPDPSWTCGDRHYRQSQDPYAL